MYSIVDIVLVEILLPLESFISNFMSRFIVVTFHFSKGDDGQWEVNNLSNLLTAKGIVVVDDLATILCTTGWISLPSLQRLSLPPTAPFTTRC